MSDDLKNFRDQFDEIVTMDVQENARNLAVRICQMLGEANKPAFELMMALGMAQAELLQSCSPDTRQGLRILHDGTVNATLKLFADMGLTPEMMKEKAH